MIGINLFCLFLSIGFILASFISKYEENPPIEDRLPPKSYFYVGVYIDSIRGCSQLYNYDSLTEEELKDRLYKDWLTFKDDKEDSRGHVATYNQAYVGKSFECGYITKKGVTFEGRIYNFIEEPEKINYSEWSW